MKRSCLSFLFVLLFSFSFSQETPISKVHYDMNWYQLSIGDHQKIKIFPSFWMVELAEADEYRDTAIIDAILVDTQLSETLLVVKKSNKEAFNLIRRTVSKDGTEVHFALLANSNDKASLLKRKPEFDTVKEYEIANTRVIYSEQKMQEIQSLPGLDVITANDLKKVLKQRLIWAPLLKEYLANNPAMNKNPYAIYRLAQPLVERSFIAQGYNPYKEVVYNFEKTFKDDPEIIQLLTAEL